MTVEVAKKMVELTTTVEDYRKKKKKKTQVKLVMGSTDEGRSQ